MVHTITNAALFLENVGGYFFYLGKTLNWVVLGVFHGDLDFLISMKNPSNYPIKSFARLKKITTLIFKESVALIVNIILYYNIQEITFMDPLFILAGSDCGTHDRS